MPAGKGTYGKQVGRPPKKKKLPAFGGGGLYKKKKPKAGKAT
jgi:hypothetical protein|tara:strand:+ start:1079 stop:1204 length:126 start_codon:yes stop_codon:yes gene_type:complete